MRQGDHDILVHCFAGCDPADVLRELASVVPGKKYSFPDGPARAFDSTGIARHLWSQAVEIMNTWGEAYCRYRGITEHHDDLRYHPRCPRGRKPDTVFEPALLVGVRQGGDISAVQRIYLKRGGQGYRSKLMIGNPQAGSWQGRRPSKAWHLPRDSKAPHALQNCTESRPGPRSEPRGSISSASPTGSRS